MAYSSVPYQVQQITFQYREAMRKANHLDELANRLSRRVAGEIRNLSQDVRDQWRGDEANVFSKKNAIIEAEVLKTVKQIRNCAATIRRIARQTMQKEMEAAEIAARRAR